MIGIPSAIICSIRFFIIKENDYTGKENSGETKVKTNEKINFREGVYLLAHNKYVLILAAALLITNIASNMTAVNPFYFEVVVGDLSKQAVVNAMSAIGQINLERKI